jgi:predicted nucleic acid-binding protein
MSADFLDSNIFIYTFDTTDIRKSTKARSLIDTALGLGNGHISFQVVQETLRVITGKLQRPAQAEEAQAYMQSALLPLWSVMPSAPLYAKALALQARWQYSFYDRLIVAAALQARCDRLLTEDLQDGQRIEGLLIENPFKD